MDCWIDPETGAELYSGELECTGRCIFGYDILMPGDAPGSVMSSVAYPDPMCELHGGSDVWPNRNAAWQASEAARLDLHHAYARGWLS